MTVPFWDPRNGGTPVKNPDDGQWYVWVPVNGNIDPDDGLPVIVGQWFKVRRSQIPASASDGECPAVACCPTSPWTYSSH